MSRPEILKGKGTKLPRWLYVSVALVFWLPGVPLVHGLLPRALSRLTPRCGWTKDRPGTWNLLGLIPVIAGSACLLWIMRLHLAHTPERVALERTPSYLLQQGPYALTRNPMYLAELALWFGWTIFYGSLGVLIGSLLFFRGDELRRCALGGARSGGTVW